MAPATLAPLLVACLAAACLAEANGNPGKLPPIPIVNKTTEQIVLAEERTLALGELISFETSPTAAA